MKMLNGSVLTKVQKETEKSGGIILGQTKMYKVLRVVDVCEGSDVEIGRDIYVKITSGLEVTLHDQKYIVINESEILLSI